MLLDSGVAMSKILVVTYGGGHVNMVIPVVKKLLTIGHEVTVLGLTTAGGALAQAGIDYIGYSDLLKFSNNSQQALDFGRQLVGDASASAVVPYAESVAYHGLSYQELWFQCGEKKAKAKYEGQGRQAFFPVQLLTNYMQHLAPDLVCATNSPRSERAALQAASNLGIASVCLVDLFAKQEMAWIAKPDFASKICVVTEYVRQAFHKAGRPLDDMVVTGNPVFDKVVSVRDRQQRRQLDSHTPTLLWASQVEPEKHPFTGAKGDPSLPLKIDAALLTIAKNNPQWNFVFRFHPSENRVLQYAPCNVSMGDKSEDLYDLLSRVDLLVTMTSTVGFEAALADIPVISIDLSIFTEDVPYAEMGISQSVADLDTLESVIDNMLSRKQAVSVEGLPEVGKATDQIVTVMQELLD